MDKLDEIRELVPDDAVVFWNLPEPDFNGSPPHQSFEVRVYYDDGSGTVRIWQGNSPQHAAEVAIEDLSTD